MYSIHYMYPLFAILLIALMFVKNTKIKAIAVSTVFVLIFICARIGADYEGYKLIYDECLIKYRHGEWLFVKICQLFKTMGVSYEWFRIIFLTSFYALFAFGLYKLSPNFVLSFLIMFLQFLIYLVSAYRQFASMSIFIFSLWLYLKKDKKELAIILNFVAVFIHKLAILQFALLLIMYLWQYLKPRSKQDIGHIKKLTHIKILACAVIIRIVLYFVLKITYVQEVLSNYIFEGYVTNVSLISFGFIARFAGLLLIMGLYYNQKEHSKLVNTLMFMYYFAMLTYILVPYELIMGRLINNFKILEIVLVPIMLYEHKSNYITLKSKKVSDKHIYVALFMILSIAVFTAQLLLQVGYTPFDNLILGVI